MTNTQKFDRKSAAKTLHKPCRGFEYRYVVYLQYGVYDKYTQQLLKQINGKVTLIGINNKEYKLPLQKIFCQWWII